MTRQHVVETHYYDGTEHVIKKDITNDYYIHCNMGWYENVGSIKCADGYYLSNVFNAQDGPEYDNDGERIPSWEEEVGFSNYQYNKEMFIGIRK